MLRRTPTCQCITRNLELPTISWNMKPHELKRSRSVLEREEQLWYGMPGSNSFLFVWGLLWALCEQASLQFATSPPSALMRTPSTVHQEKSLQESSHRFCHRLLILTAMSIGECGEGTHSGSVSLNRSLNPQTQFISTFQAILEYLCLTCKFLQCSSHLEYCD